MLQPAATRPAILTSFLLPQSLDTLVTDGLRSYGAAQREVMPDVRHRRGRYLNNRAENSHRPTRRRERQTQLQHLNFVTS